MYEGMIRKLRLGAFTVPILVMIVSAEILSAQEITFRFNPPDSITFRQNLKTTVDSDMGALGKRLEVTESQSRITLLKEGDGYRLIATPLSVSTTLDGQPVDNPLVSMMQNVVVQYYLDKEGQIDSIRGYEELMNLMKSMLPPEAIQSLASILNPDALASRDIAEWNGKIGSFIGKTAEIGEVWTWADSFAIQMGPMLKFYSVVKFMNIAKCGGADCVRVEYRYDSDGSALFEFAGKAADQLAAALGDSTVKTELSGGTIMGQGERLIEPSTMLIHSETSSRIMKTKLNVPGQGEIDMTRNETRDYSYDYAP